MDDFQLKDGETFVFAGDSITDCGRRAEHAPFGNGYVQAVVDLVTARHPDRKIVYHNAGISGTTADDLWDRWHDDVLVRRPTWISILIGICDHHRHRENPALHSPAQFEETYRKLLTITKEKSSARIILLSPFFISSDANPLTTWGQVLRLLPEYIAVVRRMAQDFNATFVPTHDLFTDQLRHRPADVFCPEPVHPSLSGHLVIAHGLLKALNW